MKTKHAADWQARRRWRALELQRAGWSQDEIAEALGVSKGAVSRWMKAVERAGQEALQARPRSGAPPRLTAEQLGLVPELLSHGTEAWGFRGAVWTCARVAQVIREEFGVSYHKAHVSRLLKQLHWTPQLPIERARQRDEPAIERWRIEVWPMVKKKRREKAE